MKDRQGTSASPEHSLVMPTDQTRDLVTWARVRSHYIEAPDLQSSAHDPELEALDRRLLQPMAPERAEEMLTGVLTSKALQTLQCPEATSGEALVHSLEAARSRRRRPWVWLGSSFAAVAAAAALLLVTRSGPLDPNESSQLVAIAPVLDDLHFQLDVQGGYAAMRGDVKPGSGDSSPPGQAEYIFDMRDEIVLFLTPAERIRDDVQLRLVATQGERRIMLDWQTKVGDAQLGDREIQGKPADLGPGVWRLDIEAVDRQSGARRWRGGAVLRINSRSTE